MKSIKQIFHILSYLQYPLSILTFFFLMKPYFYGLGNIKDHLDLVLKDLNYSLIFLGLGISFATLQDTTKILTKIDRKVLESPKKGKLLIITISCTTLLFLTFGIFGYFITKNEKIKELSFGSIVLAIGLIGFLKTAIEMFDNHRKDKNTTANNG